MFRAFILVICGCAAIALAACGSDSEEAAYCKQREELQTQITRIRDTDVIKEGTNVFRARVDSALTQAKKLSASAESDFPQETRDLDGAISAVKTSLAALEQPDQRRAALVRLPGQLEAAADAGDRLQAAVRDKCD